MRAWTKSVTRHSKVNITFAFLFIVALVVIILSRIDFSSPRPTLPGSTSSYTKALYGTDDMRSVSNVAEVVPVINANLTKTPKTTQVVPPSIQVDTSKQTEPSLPLSTVPMQDLVNTIVVPVLTLPTQDTNTSIVNIDANSGCLSVLSLEACID